MHQLLRLPQLIFERRSHYSDPSGTAPGTTGPARERTDPSLLPHVRVEICGLRRNPGALLCRLKNVMPIIKALWDAGQRSFTATNILMGGDPCPSQTKQLNISVMFWETYDYVEYYYLQIPENTTKDLSPVCCVPR